MSFIGSMFGSGNGAGYKAQGAPIVAPTTAAQANTAYGQTQDALAQQQAFVNALAQQNGLGNQSAVFNQLQGVANGTGPNPAAAQLAQATGANNASTAALMASQRGASANPGMIARQAAMQGAANNQNAAGQTATLQANQSLNALNQMGGLATNQANQQAQGIQSLNTAAQGQQGQILNGINNQNQSNVQMQSNQNTANEKIAEANQQSQSKGIGGLLSGAAGLAGTMFGGPIGGALGSAVGGALAGGGGDAGSGGPLGGLGSFMAAHGGQVPPISGPRSNVGRHLTSVGAKLRAGGQVPGNAPVPGDSFKNDTVKALLSPGEVVLPRSVTQAPHPGAAAMKFLEALHLQEAQKAAKNITAKTRGQGLGSR